MAGRIGSTENRTKSSSTIRQTRSSQKLLNQNPKKSRDYLNSDVDTMRDVNSTSKEGGLYEHRPDLNLSSYLREDTQGLGGRAPALQSNIDVGPGMGFDESFGEPAFGVRSSDMNNLGGGLDLNNDDNQILQSKGSFNKGPSLVTNSGMDFDLHAGGNLGFGAGTTDDLKDLTSGDDGLKLDSSSREGRAKRGGGKPGPPDFDLNMGNGNNANAFDLGGAGGSDFNLGNV